jgi:hypothetical protein
VAGPLRFRKSTEGWHEDRVRNQLLAPLEDSFGATLAEPRYEPGESYEARALAMDNGDLALFAWSDDAAYWLGNTETPKVLWQTNKVTFDEAPKPVSDWAQRELFAILKEDDPWLAEYTHLAWFFLPVFFSKDGRETTRRFFEQHAAGFPEATRDEALAFYDDALSTEVLDEHRYTMASKLGTSGGLDLTRMRATMAEFTVAKILEDADLSFLPEPEMDSGHALDYAVTGPSDRIGTDDHVHVEVTRPLPPAERSANTASAAVRETAGEKARGDGQLVTHEDAVLLVDCTSFSDEAWASVLDDRPSLGHEPAVVFRAEPDGTIEGYVVGILPIDLGDAVDWR